MTKRLNATLSLMIIPTRLVVSVETLQKKRENLCAKIEVSIIQQII